MQLSPDLYCGGKPVDDSGFKTLTDLGIRTVISVDGARPDVEAAKKHGLRYIHIPIGYDGATPEAEAAMGKALRTATRPFYIHCHHGVHRGPVMGAIALMLEKKAPPAVGEAVLKRAGTSKEYPGLWSTVADFDPDTLKDYDPPLHEIAPVTSFVKEMSHIDAVWDELNQCQAAGWQAPKTHPDLVPEQTALLLSEHFHELARNGAKDRDAQLKAWLHQAEERVVALRQALLAGDHAAADQRLKSVKQSCSQCHATYRNRP